MVVAQLPTELIRDIISLAHPCTPTAVFSRERYDDLLSFALVSQAWRELAQRELFGRAEFHGIAAVHLLSKALEGSAPRLQAVVKSLWITMRRRSEQVRAEEEEAAVRATGSPGPERRQAFLLRHERDQSHAVCEASRYAFVFRLPSLAD